MTLNSFYDIPVGATQEEVIAAGGKPFVIRQLKDGSVEYEYIERFKAAGRNINERHYYILMKDGKVISKRVKQTSPPPYTSPAPYTFDSYEMQTTQNGNASPPETETPP